MKDLANHKAGDIHGLKPELLKWAANDLCAPITLLFNMVRLPDLMDYKHHPNDLQIWRKTTPGEL
jgi:hypothetical protein